MKKTWKRFIAFAIVFASVMSFLPDGILGNMHTANAAVYESNQDTSKSTQVFLTKVTDSSQPNFGEVVPTITDNGQIIYNDGPGGTNYNLAQNDVSLSSDEINKLKIAMSEKADNEKTQDINGADKTYTMTVVISQRVLVTNVNKIAMVDSNGNYIANELGISVKGNKTDHCLKDSKGYWITTIENLPSGTNSINYNVYNMKRTYTYSTKDGWLPEQDKEELVNQSNMHIYNGTDFANNQVNELVFDEYVGNAAQLNDDDKKNERPFLYHSTAIADKNAPLKYTWKVPDSLTALQYNFKFDTELSGDAQVYLNGQLQDKNKIQTKNNVVSGYLTNLSDKEAYIVIKVDTIPVNTGGSSDNVQKINKLYSIQLSYEKKNIDEDYSIKNAGISKLDNNDNSSVEAYIGKEFTHTINQIDNVDEYNGKITIDSRARMVSINPELVRPGEKTAYVLSNNYVRNGISSKLDSIIKDGKQYIDFQYGDTSNAAGNVLELDVYAGDGNGNIDNNVDGSGQRKLLARYYLTVEIPSSSEKFNVDLLFDGFCGKDTNLQEYENAKTYITPEGQDDIKNTRILFNPSRYNYNLYVNPDKGDKTVNIALGAQSSNSEYLRVYLSNSSSASSYYEADESKNNEFQDSGSREHNGNIDINYGNAKAIIVQTYYDETEPVKDENGNDTGKKKLVKSHKIGEKYTFFLPENITSGDSGNDNLQSSDASLSNLRIKGQTLIGDDNKTGFYSDKYNYTVNVPKDEDSVSLTAIANNSNIKSIVATVTGSDSTYSLESNEESDIPLSSTGTTKIAIEVTAQDGKTTKKYILTVVNNTKGNSAKLKDLILSEGSYNFDPDNSETKVQVDQNTSKVSITPIPEDSKAKVTVNGQSYDGTAISVNLKGSQKKEIEIVVKSEDGETKKTYTVVIKRVSALDEDEDNGNGTEEDAYYDYDNDCWVDLSKYDEWGTTPDGRVVYYNTHNRQVKDSWISTGGKYYYINKSGYRSSGWKVDSADGKTYYLDPTTGEMRTGWLNVNNNWYYLNARGIMQKKWLYLNNNWYYFMDNGQMVANTSMYVDGKMYKFRQDGTMYL